MNGRSFADLAVLEAGVSSFKNAVASDPTATAFGGTGVRLVFNGMRPELNNIVVDGTDAIDAFGNAPGSAAGVLLGVDTVRAFSTITSTYSAEYGRAAGGVINVVTRSGSNDFTGRFSGFIATIIWMRRTSLTHPSTTPAATSSRKTSRSSNGISSALRPVAPSCPARPSFCQLRRLSRATGPHIDRYGPYRGGSNGGSPVRSGSGQS